MIYIYKQTINRRFSYCSVIRNKKLVDKTDSELQKFFEKYT